jgi:hypothetical protein
MADPSEAAKDVLLDECRDIVGDEAFTAFQEKLATVVTNARARGETVGNWRRQPGCICPLGAHPSAQFTHPSSGAAHDGGWPEVALEHLSAFINGYGGDFSNSSSPYAQLGQRYRELYP